MNLRPPEIVMQPERLGAMWGSRLSFVRRMINQLFEQGWHISVESNRLDDSGHGEMVYFIKTGQTDHPPLRYVVFSTKLSEEERQDRVIADRWDAATALIEGELTADRLESLRAGVPRQEYGRAEPGTLVWSRGNRSSRFFDHVVDSLAAGSQPDINYLAQGGYILRSTAYYANAKFGLTSYKALRSHEQEKKQTAHPLAKAYMAQMFSAFLFRQFSIDLAEHIASCRRGEPVKLASEIGRFIGIGNATGMGLVPYVINNPHVINNWLMARETLLAEIRQFTPAPELANGLNRQLKQARLYFDEDVTKRKGIFADRTRLISDLDQLLEWVTHYKLNKQFTKSGQAPQTWETLTKLADKHCHIESVELLNSLLIEIYPALVPGVEEQLDDARLEKTEPAMRLKRLRQIIKQRYRWALELDLDHPDARKYFWYYSADSEEPLMGERGVTPGEAFERPLDIPFQVQGLMAALKYYSDQISVGEFLLENPDQRGIVERIQMTRDLPYGEVHTNLMDAKVIPLYTQRFQLAQYGMERFNPQSIYWVRVTLLQGAPTAEDLNHGTNPEWSGFALRPAC